MFHTIITLAYIIPNIYLFIRIWQLFINKGYKLVYTFIYLLFGALYPISNIYHDEATGFPARFFSFAGNYILPFYLYLFLFVLLLDLLLLINWITKVIPSEKFSNPTSKKTLLSIILSLAVIVVIAGVINFNTIRTTVYNIEIPGRASKIKQLKIAFVADFHLEEETNIHFVERFERKIADINPDIMLFGGDIVEGDRDNENMENIEKLIRKIRTKYGTFTVLGNHEFYAGQDKGSFFDKAGMRVLCDTVIEIEGLFSLGGRNDSHFRNRKSLDYLLKSANVSLPLILVDHRPTEIDKNGIGGLDVQLSGHTHNGQLFPINLITRKVYELSWGYMKTLNTHYFVTSGLRLWGPPVRTTGKSEIMVINITFLVQ